MMDIDLGCHLNVLVDGIDSPDLERALDGLAGLGYRSVVLHPVDPGAVDPVALGERFRSRGLTAIPIAGQTPDADVSSGDPVVAQAGAAALREMVEFTAALGSDQLNGIPYGLFGHPSGPTEPAAFARSAGAVGAVAEFAAARGVTMTFEVVNRYETSAINTAAQARDFLAASGSAHLAVHLDTFHMGVEEADPAAAIVATVPRLGYLELGQSGRGGIERGSVDVAALLRAALVAGYTGRIGVEAFRRGGLVPPVADLLAIWREPYDDGLALVRDAAQLVRRVVDEVGIAG